MQDCIFCQIIAGKLPSQLIYSSDDFISIMDIAPLTPGHVLVISKKHYDNIMELPSELGNKLVSVLKKVGEAVVSATNSQGFNLIQNNGKYSGQVIPHLHFHIVPRKAMDGVNFNWQTIQYKKGEMEEVAEKIRKKL